MCVCVCTQSYMQNDLLLELLTSMHNDWVEPYGFHLVTLVDKNCSLLQQLHVHLYVCVCMYVCMHAACKVLSTRTAPFFITFMSICEVYAYMYVCSLQVPQHLSIDIRGFLSAAYMSICAICIYDLCMQLARPSASHHQHTAVSFCCIYVHMCHTYL